MDLLKLSLPTIAENLALDEALLEEAETKHHAQGILRLWEASQLAVVLGRSSAVADEVNLPYCEQHEIAVARRCSGGASVVVGPGCLMYSVVLPLDTRPELARIDNAHCFVLQTMLRAIRPRFPNAACAGTSDMAAESKKFSGNSLRVKRTHLLYHGTLLYDFPLPRIQQCLRTAPRQPAYRAGRDHLDFVCNLSISRTDLESAIATAWGAHDSRQDWPEATTSQLLHDRYHKREWNLAR